MLTGTLDSLVAAMAMFVASHFLLSSRPLRESLVRILGERGFLIAYSAVALAVFAWMLRAYGNAPEISVWVPVPLLRWVPIVTLAIACILLVTSVTTPSLTRLGGDRAASAGGPGNPSPGIISVTRHPGLWGIALWALSHLAANGDAAGMILFSGILILSFGGMAHIDQRREASLGGAWGPTKLTTSVIPFAAILSGRTRLDWKGIGWQRPLGGLALYAVLIFAHPWIAGVALVPG